MMGGCILLIVIAITIPPCFFAPNPLDDLTANVNLTESPKDVLQGSGKKPEDVIHLEGLRCKGANDDCCTESNQCKEYDGDCDFNKDCMPGLHCGTNNCLWGDCNFFGDCDDCCFYVGCSEIAFACTTGPPYCIHRSFLCNGEDDCKDGSDESQETCKSYDITFQKVPMTSSGRLATVKEMQSNVQLVEKLLKEWDWWTIAIIDGGKVSGKGYGGIVEEGDFTKQVEDNIIGEKIIVLES